MIDAKYTFVVVDSQVGPARLKTFFCRIIRLWTYLVANVCDMTISDMVCMHRLPGSMKGHILRGHAVRGHIVLLRSPRPRGNMSLHVSALDSELPDVLAG